MSDKTYEMIGSDGEQYGPFTLQELQETLSQGRANTQTQIRETGTETWLPLGQLLGSQSHRAGASPRAIQAKPFQVINRRLDVGLAFSAGGERYSRQHMGIMIGAGAIYPAIFIAAGMVGASCYPFLGHVCK